MIFSEVTLTGDADLTSITAGSTKTMIGMGLLPGIIFDPHFLKRQRLNRLVSLVLDYPGRLGLGVDERTAIVIKGTQFEVLGPSSVVVLDARSGEIPGQRGGQPSSGRNINMHVLAHGMMFSLGSVAPLP
jgi:cyanophycinase